jgi:lipocalin
VPGSLRRRGFEATPWLAWTIELAEALLAHFEDREAGGFHFTADDHESLILRPKTFGDDATPAGHGVAARVLLRLGYLLAEPRYLDAAERTLRAAWSLIERYPHAHTSLLMALDEFTAPPPVVVDANLPPNQTYLGTWYEQGSVRQFFSIGLVNTKAVYSLNDDGTIKVENSGNYFGPNGPQSNITGSAVPVNAFNTRLNVGFFFGEPNSDEPGNYWILDYAPDYSWAIVGDANGTQGYILTRDQAFAADNPEAYDALVARAYELGVRRTIIQTRQFPESAPTAALPGPSVLPAGVRV